MNPHQLNSLQVRRISLLGHIDIPPRAKKMIPNLTNQLMRSSRTVRRNKGLLDNPICPLMSSMRYTSFGVTFYSALLAHGWDSQSLLTSRLIPSNQNDQSGPRILDESAAIWRSARQLSSNVRYWHAGLSSLFELRICKPCFQSAIYLWRVIWRNRDVRQFLALTLLL